MPDSPPPDPSASPGSRDAPPAVRRGSLPLADLVRQTDGLQPWRRVFHATNGMMAALLLHVLRPDRPVALLVLGAIAAGLIALDLVRLRAPAVNTAFFRAFRLIASPREEGKVASSTWFVLGLFLAVLLFPLDAVIPGILVLALADPAASVVGRLKGRRPLGKGTVEGTLVFLAVALAVLLPILPLRAALAGAFAGAAAEIFLTRLDDNLSIPLAVAAAVTLLGV